MLKWVEVFGRILRLYNVKTQQELAMAMGMPVSYGLDGVVGAAIPWPILERAVADKGVSWDWLLTGRGERLVVEGAEIAEAKPKDPGAKPAAKAPTGMRIRPPRIATRELERVLLHPAEGGDAAADPRESVGQRPVGATTVVDRLERIKDRMQAEIDRVEKLLEGR